MKQILFISLLFTVLSCSKKSNDTLVADNIKPKLTIIAPAKSETYRTGDPLCFKGDVIDGSSLKTVKLMLFNSNDLNTPVIQHSYPVSERSIYIEQKMIIPPGLSGQCVLQFEATDFYNNRAVTTLNFSSN